MPKDTVVRAIKKGTGGGGASLVEISFEGYASNGIAVFVEATTDNNKRTVASVRSVFNKYGGNLGTNGSLSFIFDIKGVFTINKSAIGNMDIEEFEMELIDAGLEEMDEIEGLVILYTSLDDFGNMQNQLESLNIEVANAETQRIPNNTTALDVDNSKKVLRLIDKMEEDEDVNCVYHNLEMTDDLIKILESEN